MSQIRAQKELKIGKKQLDKIIKSLQRKIYKIEELGLKYNAYDMDKEEIIDRCKKMGKDETYIKYCIMAYYDKRPDEEISKELCIEPETVIRYKYTRRKELENC